MHVFIDFFSFLYIANGWSFTSCGNRVVRCQNYSSNDEIICQTERNSKPIRMHFRRIVPDAFRRMNFFSFLITKRKKLGLITEPHSAHFRNPSSFLIPPKPHIWRSPNVSTSMCPHQIVTLPSIINACLAFPLYANRQHTSGTWTQAQSSLGSRASVQMHESSAGAKGGGGGGAGSKLPVKRVIATRETTQFEST